MSHMVLRYSWCLYIITSPMLLFRVILLSRPSIKFPFCKLVLFQDCLSILILQGLVSSRVLLNTKISVLSSQSLQILKGNKSHHLNGVVAQLVGYVCETLGSMPQHHTKLAMVVNTYKPRTQKT